MLRARRSTPAPLAALASVVLLAGCSQTSAGAPPGPAGDIWPQGDFELEADIAYRSEGPTRAATRRVKHKAVLTIDADGEMQLMSTAGLCREDPMDNRYRNRRFLCGEATYDVEPSGGDLVSGRVSVQAEVMVRGERRCVQYTTDSQGNRTCTRWAAPMETQWRTLTERLRVRRLGGEAP